MSRYIFGSILICVVAALIFFVWSAEREKRLDEINRKFLSQIDYGTGIAVYARDEIQKGTLITKELIEERRISVNKMPDHIATSASEVLGCKARFGVTKNYIISLYDLDPYPPDLNVAAVVCIKRIPGGTAIRDDAVEVRYEMDSSLPKNRFESVSMVLGRLARYDIEVGQVLIDNQVQQRWFEMQKIK